MRRPQRTFVRQSIVRSLFFFSSFSSVQFQRGFKTVFVVAVAVAVVVVAVVAVVAVVVPVQL